MYDIIIIIIIILIILCAVYYYYYYYMGAFLYRVHGFVKAGGRGSVKSMDTAVRTQKVDKGAAGPLRQSVSQTLGPSVCPFWPPCRVPYFGAPAPAPMQSHSGGQSHVYSRAYPNGHTWEQRFRDIRIISYMIIIV